MPAQMHGARPGHSTSDVTWPLMLAIESANQKSEQLAGAMLDRMKCFDKMVREISFELETACGFERWITRSQQKLYKKLKRFLVISTFAGPIFESTNGFAQGCAITVMRINLLMSIWIKRQLSRIPALLTAVFVDDCNVMARGPNCVDSIKISFEETVLFDKLSGQKIHPDKTVAYANDNKIETRLAQIIVDTKHLKVVNGSLLVGTS